jgi:ankyrin repeat protein
MNRTFITLLFVVCAAGLALYTTDSRAQTPPLNDNKPSSLLSALYRQDAAAVEAILKAGTEPDINEASALGDFDRVRKLIEQDKSLVNRYSADGFSPLHLAAYFGHQLVADLLIKNGAELNAKSKNALLATPLQSAAAGNQQNVAELLLKHRADANCKGQGGYSPLHEVASSGQTSFAELLLLHGADIQAKSDDGKTALQVAKDSKQPAMVWFLQNRIEESNKNP